MADVLPILLALVPAIGIFFFVRTIVGKRIDAAVRAARAEEAVTRAAVEERLRGREEQLAEARGAIERAAARENELEERASALRAALAGNEEKLRVFAEAEKKLGDAFQSLASQALSRNNQQFLDLAKQNLEKLQGEAKGELDLRQQAISALVAPLHEALGKVDSEVRRIEAAREQAYGTLTEQVRSLVSSQERLQAETGRLVTALRRPEVRGSWGEVQLKRAVEFAGMVDHVDFRTQESVAAEEGRLRPDMVVKLPGGKQVVVDSKAPLDAYLAAVEAPNEEARKAALVRHARQVRDHVRKLAAKSYWEQFENAPEFVALFVPGEAIFCAALDEDPQLIEEAFQSSVLIVTPATLVALLKTVYYGWRQETVAANAAAISEAAKLLHERLRTFSVHLAGVGRGLTSALSKYNEAVGSFDTRVMPQGRRLEELQAASGERLASPAAVEIAPRPVAAAAGLPEGDTASLPEPTARPS
jgi:DNA recombination protein RmuC